jgi:hypothetical protein
MQARTSWLWKALLVSVCIGYELFVHAWIARGDAGTFGPLMVAGVPHAAINLFLLWFFARTLLPGREPLITGFARRFHGSLPAHMEAYTRRVTVAWCIFFAAQIVISASSFVVASAQTWSLFVNLLSFPLVALMFIAEYAYRILRYRNFPHASILDGIELFAKRAQVDKPSAR